MRNDLRNFDRYLESARRRLVGSTKRAAKGLLRPPDQAFDDPSIAVRDPERRQHMLEGADRELTAGVERAWEEITRYKQIAAAFGLTKFPSASHKYLFVVSSGLGKTRA